MSFNQTGFLFLHGQGKSSTVRQQVPAILLTRGRHLRIGLSGARIDGTRPLFTDATAGSLKCVILKYSTQQVRDCALFGRLPALRAKTWSGYPTTENDTRPDPGK